MSRVSARVRPAEPADISSLVDLIAAIDTSAGTFSGRALLEPSREHLTERLTDIVKESDRSLLVAVDDVGGSIVGLLVAQFADIGAIDLTPVLQISHLIVTPRQRRRGIGRTLLAAAVHLADERGVDRVVATAAANSREANRYLARLGFAPLVTHRIAQTVTLRRALGISDAPERMAVLRRARMARRHRGDSGREAARGA